MANIAMPMRALLCPNHSPARTYEVTRPFTLGVGQSVKLDITYQSHASPEYPVP